MKDSNPTTECGTTDRGTTDKNLLKKILLVSLIRSEKKKATVIFQLFRDAFLSMRSTKTVR